MSAKAFGELVRALREDRWFYDDEGRRLTWTRRELARRTQTISPGSGAYALTEHNVRDIETGNMALLRPDRHIEPLARALELTEHQKVEFYAVAEYVYSIADECVSDNQVERLLQWHAFPATAFTSLGDMVGFNQYLYLLYGHSPQSIELLNNGSMGPNLLAAYFDPTFNSRIYLGGSQNWEAQILRHLLAFRTRVFRCRATRRYRDIMREARHYPEFLRLWNMAESQERGAAEFPVNPAVRVYHPHFGEMEFLMVHVPPSYVGQDIFVSIHIPTHAGQQNYARLQANVSENRIYLFRRMD